MSTFSTQFFAHLIPSDVVVAKPVQLDTTGENMSDFATAFFAHMLASDVSAFSDDLDGLMLIDLDEISYSRHPPTAWNVSFTLREQSKHLSTRSSGGIPVRLVNADRLQLVLDPRDSHYDGLRFTSPGDSEYYDCCSARNEDTDAPVYEHHLFVVPKSGDTWKADNNIIYFDSVVDAYRVSMAEPFDYQFGKRASRGYINRVWDEDSAGEVKAKSIETFESTWTKLATQAWGSSKLSNWADEAADYVEEEISEISTLAKTVSAGYTHTETSSTGDLAPNEVLDAYKEVEEPTTGCVAVTAEVEPESGNATSHGLVNQHISGSIRTICDELTAIQPAESSSMAAKVLTPSFIVSEQEETSRYARALNLDTLSTRASISSQVGPDKLRGLNLHGNEEIVLRGHSTFLELPTYCPRSSDLIVSDWVSLNFSPEVGATKEVCLASYLEQQAKGETSIQWELAHGVSAISETRQSMTVIEEDEEEDEEDKRANHAIAQTARGDSDEGPEEDDVPDWRKTLLGKQVPESDISQDKVNALRGKWGGPGIARVDLIWQSQSRIHKRMVEEGLYVEKIFEPSEPVDILSLMGIKDRSGLSLSAKQTDEERPSVDQSNAGYEDFELRKLAVVQQAHSMVDLYGVDPPTVFSPGFPLFTFPSKDAWECSKRSYRPKKSSMVQVDFCYQEHTIQLEPQDAEEADAEDNKPQSVHKILFQAPDEPENFVSDEGGLYLEARDEDDVNAENEDFYGVDKSSPQPAEDSSGSNLRSRKEFIAGGGFQLFRLPTPPVAPVVSEDTSTPVFKFKFWDDDLQSMLEELPEDDYGEAAGNISASAKNDHSAGDDVTPSTLSQDQSDPGACLIGFDELVEDHQPLDSPEKESLLAAEETYQEPPNDAEEEDVPDNMVEEYRPEPAGTISDAHEYPQEVELVAQDPDVEEEQLGNRDIEMSEIDQDIEEIPRTDLDNRMEEEIDEEHDCEDQSNVEDHNTDEEVPPPPLGPLFLQEIDSRTVEDLAPSVLGRRRGHNPRNIPSGIYDTPGSRNISGSSESTAVATPTSPPAETLTDLEETIILKLSMLDYGIKCAKARRLELEKELQALATTSATKNVRLEFSKEVQEPEHNWAEALAALDKVGDEFDSKVKSLGAQLKGSVPEEEPPIDTPDLPPLLLFLAAFFVFCFLLL